ncbi:MAG: acyltransferase [Glaciihabitans sp.]|nr:acyltransferase [Glaciihabitans sp.]
MIPTFPRAQLPALTGIRAFAAFWVFTRHFRTELLDAFPALHVVAPLFNVGYLGVDLFFILSGFILTYTHFDGMTDGYNWRKALGFLWLRIGRVWPLTSFVLLLFGLVFVAEIVFSHDPKIYVGQVDAGRLIQHLLMVQAWSTHPLDWNGLDWSISAEWMAYLTFAVGVVVLGRFAAVASRRTMIIIVALLTLPMIIIGFSMQDDTNLLFDQNSLSLFPGVVPVRVVTEFWIGAILAILLRARLRENRTINFPLPTILGALIVAGIYIATALDPHRWVSTLLTAEDKAYKGTDLIASTETIIVLPLLVLLIVSLAVFRRDPLVWLLSTRALNLGGRVSFALYLSHPLVIGTVLAVLPAVAGSPPLVIAVVVTGVVAAWVFAWVLWRFIEEPSRKIARRMLPASIHV